MTPVPRTLNRVLGRSRAAATVGHGQAISRAGRNSAPPAAGSGRGRERGEQAFSSMVPTVSVSPSYVLDGDSVLTEMLAKTEAGGVELDVLVNGVPVGSMTVGPEEPVHVALDVDAADSSLIQVEVTSVDDAEGLVVQVRWRSDRPWGL